jgi:ribosomal protein S18 acetylase RimI-like enzyme
LTDVTCRPGERGDFDRIAEVWWESSRRGDGAPDPHPALVEMRARIDQEVADEWRVSVAVRDGRIVGFLAVKLDSEVLDQLFILPAAQGGGVGQALFEIAKQAMPGGFTLRTAAANARARRFYERAGMVLAETALHPKYGNPVCYYRWRPGQSSPANG